MSSKEKEIAADDSAIEKTKSLKASLVNLRSLLKVDGESHAPQWCKDRMQELENHLNEERFIRSKQDESYDALSKYNRELTGQIEGLAKSRDELEEKWNRSEETVQSGKKVLFDKVIEWKKEKEHLETQNSQNQHKIETLIARNNFYQNQIEGLQEKKRKAKEVRKELDELRDYIGKKEAENAELKEEMEAKQAKNEEKYDAEVSAREKLEKTLEETEAKLEETKLKLEKAETGINEAAQSLCSILSVIKVSVGERAEDDDKSDDDGNLTLESIVSKIGAAVESMQSIFADTQYEVDVLQQEAEGLRANLNECRGDLLDLEERYEEKEDRCDELERIIEELEKKTETRQTMTKSGVDEEEGEQSDESQGDEDEDGETESDEMEQVARARALQNDYGSDSSVDSRCDSDAVEVDPSERASAKRALEEEDSEESSAGDDDNSRKEENSNGEFDQLPPSPKRAKVDDDEVDNDSVCFSI